MGTNNKRILIVLSTAIVGGGSQVAFDIVRGLQDEFSLLVALPEGFFAQRYKESNISVRIIPVSFGPAILAVHKLIREYRPYLIQAHGTRAAFWSRCAFLFLRTRPKLIYTLHGLHITYRSWWQRVPLLYLERILNRFVDRMICVSETVQEMAKRYSVIGPSKVIIIPNGIDVEKFQGAPPSDLTALGIPQHSFIVAAIQRLNYPKDVPTVFGAFHNVCTRLPKTVLLVVGSGPDEKELKDYAEKIGISKRVFFLGERTDMPALLSASHLVVLSSQFEALPSILLEAWAAGKPVIGTDVPGIREVIQDGRNGFLVPFGNTEAMAEKMLTLLSDAEFCETMGKAGAKMVKEKYSLLRTVQQYRGLYQSFL